MLIICTPSFKDKSNARDGGVGYEGSVITAEVLSGTHRRKFIPLLRQGEWKEAAPSWLLGSVYIDFRRDGDQLEGPYSELLETLHGRRECPPPIGSPPFPEKHRKELLSPNENHGLGADKASHPSYPFVLKALLATGRNDPATYDLGRAWLLRTSHADPSWPHVFNAMMSATPRDHELGELGLAWLMRTSQEDPSWTHVWNALMNARPYDEELRNLGRVWLTRF